MLKNYLLLFIACFSSFLFANNLTEKSKYFQLIQNEKDENAFVKAYVFEKDILLQDSGIFFKTDSLLFPLRALYADQNGYFVKISSKSDYSKNQMFASLWECLVCHNVVMSNSYPGRCGVCGSQDWLKHN